MRGIRIERAEMVAKMHFLEQVSPKFRDGLPTVLRSFRHHQNRILRVERRQGGGIVIVERRIEFSDERENLLV